MENKFDCLSSKNKEIINEKLKICWLPNKKEISVGSNFRWLYTYLDLEEEKYYRYILGKFKNHQDPKKILICFGLNPSCGVPEGLEPTVEKLCKIAFSCKDKHGKDKYDGWVMLNLFPLRNSSSQKFLQTLKDMSESEFNTLCKKNVEYINEILTKFPKNKADILLAWGGSIKSPYLKRCIIAVDKVVKPFYDKKRSKSHIFTCYNGNEKVGILTLSGHPRHLNTDRLAKEYRISPADAVLEPFESYEDYINNIKERLRRDNP